MKRWVILTGLASLQSVLFLYTRINYYFTSECLNGDLKKIILDKLGKQLLDGICIAF